MNEVEAIRELVEQGQMPVCEVVELPSGQLVHLVKDGDAYEANTWDDVPKRHRIYLHSLQAVPEWIETAWNWMGEQKIQGEATWLVWDDHEMCLIPDPSPRPRMALATYGWQASIAAQMWGYPAFKLDLDQKQLRRLIETAMDLDAVQLQEADKWLAVAVSLHQRARVSKDSVIEDTRNYKFSVESKDTAGTTTVPKYLNLSMPIFEGSPRPSELNFRVEFTWDHDGVPYFHLQCLVWKEAIRQAAKEAVEWVVGQVDQIEGERVRELRVINGRIDV